MEENLPCESETDSHIKVSHMTFSIMKKKKRQNFSAEILEEFVDAPSQKTTVLVVFYVGSLF